MSIVNEDNIRAFIEAYGNMSDLARKAGIHRGYIYRVLNGERNPGIKFIEGMIAAGMKKEDIFKGS